MNVVKADCRCGWNGKPILNYAMGTGDIFCCPSCGSPYIRVEFPRGHQIVEILKSFIGQRW